MSNDVVIYSLIAALATLSGTTLLFYKQDWARRNSIYLVSFAAGVMLATAFLHLIPEAIGLSSQALPVVLCGILGFYLLQQLINLHHCHDEQCRLRNLGIISLVGLAFHSLLDGVAIALGASLRSDLGIMTTLAVVLHEFPEGITATSILIYARMSRAKIVLYSVIVALATPVGAILFYPLLKGASPGALGLSLAAAAGSFIYIAACDLIPQTHKAQNKLNAIILLLGVLFLFVIGRIVG